MLDSCNALEFSRKGVIGVALVNKFDGSKISVSHNGRKNILKELVFIEKNIFQKCSATPRSEKQYFSSDKNHRPPPPTPLS